MQAHLAYAFALDLTLLETPRPKNPKTIWKPLAQSQNIVADIFEAHIGALAEEDREAEIEDWVGAVLDRNKECIRTRVTELPARADKSLPQANRKRPRDENEFEGGYEMGVSLALVFEIPTAEHTLLDDIFVLMRRTQIRIRSVAVILSSRPVRSSSTPTRSFRNGMTAPTVPEAGTRISSLLAPPSAVAKARSATRLGKRRRARSSRSRAATRACCRPYLPNPHPPRRRSPFSASVCYTVAGILQTSTLEA